MRDRWSSARGATAGLVLLGIGLSWAAGASSGAGRPSGAASWPPETGAVHAEPRVEPAGQLASPLRVLRSDEQGVELELDSPEVQISARTIAGRRCTHIAMPGYASLGRVGCPDLPTWGTLIGVPPDAAPRLRLEPTEAWILAGPGEVCQVAPPPVVGTVLTAKGLAWPQLASFGRQPASCAVGDAYPATAAELSPIYYIRSQPVVQLGLYPVQVDRAARQVVVHRRLRLAVEFQSPAHSEEVAPARGRQLGAATEARGAEPAEGPFEPVLERTIANYRQARQFRPARRDLPSPAGLEAPPQPSLRLVVDEDGFYSLRPQDLRAAGVDPAVVDPRTFRLRTHGTEVAVFVAGEADGTFDEPDYLLFYGQALTSRYTRANVYWLSWGSGAGLRMASRSGKPSGSGPVPAWFPHVSHVEKDLMYNTAVPWGEGGDHWFWDLVIAPGARATRVFTITLEGLAAGEGEARLRGRLDGQTRDGADPDHHTQVRWNGRLVDDAFWDGYGPHLFEARLQSDELLEAANVLSVSCPLDLGLPMDAVYVNWFEITYPRRYRADGNQLRFRQDGLGAWEYVVDGLSVPDAWVFDITMPDRPVRVLDALWTVNGLRFAGPGAAEYVVLAADRWLRPRAVEPDIPADLRHRASGADYIMVTHRDFLDQVAPLAAWRTARGLRTAVVDVQDVYDEFSDGVLDPEAIRSFLAYAYEHWPPPAPSYVLLVGDGTLDFLDHFGTGQVNRIPPYLVAVDPWINETASDNRYACVSGSDYLPDMFIGRLPVDSPEEAAAVVTKIINYERDPPAGDWAERILLVADNADGAGDFPRFSDTLARGHLPDRFSVSRVYLGITHLTAKLAKAAIRSSINDGVLLVNYIGHASYRWWADEQLLGVDDVPTLTNGGRLPLMVAMTCYEGYFHYPGLPAFGESVVRAGDGAAVGSWSPTGLGLAAGHDILNRRLFDAFFADGELRLGPATTQAKLHLYANAREHDHLIDTYVLLGDPALALNLPAADLELDLEATPATVRPGGAITYTLTFANIGRTTATDVVLSCPMPWQLSAADTVIQGVLARERPDSRFVWDITRLAPGDRGSIAIFANLSPAACGPLVAQATITSASYDSDESNNSASLTGALPACTAYLPRLVRSP